MSNLITPLLITLLAIFCSQAFSQNANNVQLMCQGSIAPTSPLWLIHYKKKTYTLNNIRVKHGILNPDYIENVQVLKDLETTALYGLRGAAGVIIITLKKRYARIEIKRLKPYLTKI